MASCNWEISSRKNPINIICKWGIKKASYVTIYSVKISAVNPLFSGLRWLYTLELPSSQLPFFIEFKRIYAALWAINYFTSYNLFPTDKSSRHCRYSIAISIGCDRMIYILLSHAPWHLQPGSPMPRIRGWIIPNTFVFH